MMLPNVCLKEDMPFEELSYFHSRTLDSQLPIYGYPSAYIRLLVSAQDVIGHPHSKCYSAIKKNTFESVLMRWMKLEPIIQSEVSQKEKTQIQYTNTYIWNLERW